MIRIKMIKLLIKIFFLFTINETFTYANQLHYSRQALNSRGLYSADVAASKSLLMALPGSTKKTVTETDVKGQEPTLSEHLSLESGIEADPDVFKVIPETKAFFERNAENVFSSYLEVRIDGVSSLEFQQTITIKHNATLTVVGDTNVIIECPEKIDDLFIIKSGAHVIFSQIEIMECDISNNHLFKVMDQASFTLENSTFESILSDSGGVIKVNTESLLTLKNVTFIGNDDLSSGGALHIQDSSIYLENCYFYQNRALNNGGALELLNSKFTILNCDFIENESGSQGGAIGAYDLSFGIIDGSSFTRNRAGDGGAIYSNACDFNIIEVTFDENTASSRGGAINAHIHNIFKLNKCTFYANIGVKNGGDIKSESSDLKITESNFGGSTSDKDGGCLNIKSGIAIITTSNFKKCYAGNSGGAIFMSNMTNVIESCIFTENECVSKGGAIKSESNGYMEVYRSDFTDNKAEIGGSLDINSAIVIIKDMKCSGNTAQNDGGCIFVHDAEVSMKTSEFYKNKAESYGGDIATKNVALDIESSRFSESNAGYAGGSFSGREETKANFSKCKFEKCTSDDRGGAIDLFNTTANISVTSFNGNNAKSEGGAIRINNYGRTFSLVDSSFGANYAKKAPGIYAFRTYIDISGCQFYNHLDSESGVLNFKIDTIAKIHDTLFFDNRCEDKGGVAFLDQSNATFTGCTMIRNIAMREGGVFYMNNECEFIADKCSLIDNIADQGCVGYLTGNAPQFFDVSTSEISYNDPVNKGYCVDPIYIYKQRPSSIF